MPGVNDRLPAARSPSTAEYRDVMDYVELVIRLADKNMVKVAPDHVGDWYYILVGALSITIALREGKLTGGPVFDKYGVARRENYIAYADHYLQMRSDAFNLGPAGAATLNNAVLNYDVAKVLKIVPETGSEPVSPATELSVFWGLRGIEDGLADDKLYPRSSGSPRYARNAVYEKMTFAMTGLATAVVGGLQDLADAVGPHFGDSWRR